MDQHSCHQFLQFIYLFIYLLGANQNDYLPQEVFTLVDQIMGWNSTSTTTSVNSWNVVFIKSRDRRSQGATIDGYINMSTLGCRIPSQTTRAQDLQRTFITPEHHRHVRSYNGYFCFQTSIVEVGWVGGWMDRWMDEKAVLWIAYSIQKTKFCSSQIHVALNKLGHFNA